MEGDDHYLRVTRRKRRKVSRRTSHGSVPTGLGKGQGAIEIGHNRAHEWPKFGGPNDTRYGHNFVGD